MLLFSLIIILFSAIIHEYMHAWMADYLGDSTAKKYGRLTLNPISHIDLWGSIIMPALIYFGTAGSFIFGYAKPVPFNPDNLLDKKYGAAKVAAAGPCANFVTALLFGLLLRFNFAPNPIFITLMAIIIQINLVLMIFNLLPIPPLDGSKIIMPFLPNHWKTKFIEFEQYGMLFLLIFIMLGFSIITPIIRFLFFLITGI
ncbi:site-2 protease family protein [Patescibacteria group bacterium]|nr:site-2 protease family protein [Patescibacteria group bacterium]MBU1987326.1 site-2 protease family protein [Patescibacteria group bacterium]